MTSRMLAMVTCSIALSACASTFSSDLKHWDAISHGKLTNQYGEWTNCINGSIAKGGGFATVLSRCEAFQIGQAWSRLSYEDERRIITAAWQAYKSAEYEEEARMLEAIAN